MSKYYVAPEEDIIVSSRVRLARNYADIPFAPAMNREYADETVARAGRAMAATDAAPVYTLLRMIDMSEDERNRLVEHHLISYDLLKFIEFSAAIISSGETVSIMVNEEDHLRIQGLLPGMQIERTAEMAFGADEALGAEYPFAFDRQLGYLTTCPTNTGTGLRASVMMHLPALTRTKQIGGVVQAVGKLGMTVRGIYGEASEAQGGLYQLSNQVTLGRSEDDILKSLAAAANQISSTERAIREKLMSKDRVLMEDAMFRSLSAFESARIMGSEEFMNRYSDLRMAASMRVIDLPIMGLDRLMMDMLPASLNIRAGGQLNEREQNVYRASLLREEIKNLIDN